MLNKILFFSLSASTEDTIPSSPRQRKLAKTEDFETEVDHGESVRFKETEQQALYQNKVLTVRFGKMLLLGLVMNFPWLLASAKVFSKNTSDHLWYPFAIFHGFQVCFLIALHCHFTLGWSYLKLN